MAFATLFFCLFFTQIVDHHHPIHQYYFVCGLFFFFDFFFFLIFFLSLISPFSFFDFFFPFSPVFLRPMISALAVVSALCALSGTADAVSMSTFGRGSTRLSARAPVPLSPAEAAALGLPERPVAGEPGSHLVRLPRSVGHALHISGGWQLMGAYFTDIAVGSSGSTFRVLVDTGSSNLLLGAAGCDSCGAGGDGYKPETAVACASSQCRFCNNSPGCTECAFQQPFCDASARCGMGVTYGGGSSAVSGYLANDLVCGFGPTCVNTTISAITAESPARSLASNMTGGLLGLAYEYNACNPTCVQTLFAGIVAATGMSNEFAICLTPNKGGRIDMGVVNPASAGAPFKYTPITHEHWYNFAVQSITVAPAGGAQEVPVKVTPVLFAVTNDVIGSFVCAAWSRFFFIIIYLTAV
jgi:hypothetical protein